jgi:hypothetical protein
VLVDATLDNIAEYVTWVFIEYTSKAVHDPTYPDACSLFRLHHLVERRVAAAGYFKYWLHRLSWGGYADSHGDLLASNPLGGVCSDPHVNYSCRSDTTTTTTATSASTTTTLAK